MAEQSGFSLDAYAVFVHAAAGLTIHKAFFDIAYLVSDAITGKL